MTAQTLSVEKTTHTPARRPTQPINVVTTMHLKTIRPVEKSAIPVSRGKGRGAAIQQLQVVKEFNELLDHINASGLNPCEIAGEIDVSGPDVTAERQKRKSFPQTFRKILRQSVKMHNLQRQVDVIEYDKGARYFVVGRSA